MACPIIECKCHEPQTPPPLALVLSVIILGCSSIAVAAETQLQASSDFPGGSATVLQLDLADNHTASTASGYLQVGEQLGRSIDRYLQPAIRSGSP